MGESLKIDITDDLDDGSCEGDFEFEGNTYEYSISLVSDEYVVNVALKE